MSRHARKRRRRRSGSGGSGVPPRPPRPTLAQRIEERPKAPWHPFPLVELSILAGIVLLIAGVLTRDDARGKVMIVCGLALGSLGGLDTTLREHFAGYRSHTLVLAALPALAAGTAVGLAGAPWIAAVLVVAAVFVAAFAGLRRIWRRTISRART